jgi:hypothetical protein
MRAFLRTVLRRLAFWRSSRSSWFVAVRSSSQKKPRALPDPEEIFRHGVRFLYAEDLLRKEAVNNPRTSQLGMMPVMVLSAFAAELFLKCLLILEGQTPPDSHNLNMLFKRLPHKRKARIEQLWDKFVSDASANFEESERQLSSQEPQNCPGRLRRCIRKKMRYVYEDPKKVKFYIIHLAPALINVILEIRPDWRH